MLLIVLEIFHHIPLSSTPRIINSATNLLNCKPNMQLIIFFIQSSIMRVAFSFLDGSFSVLIFLQACAVFTLFRYWTFDIHVLQALLIQKTHWHRKCMFWNHPIYLCLRYYENFIKLCIEFCVEKNHWRNDRITLSFLFKLSGLISIGITDFT